MAESKVSAIVVPDMSGCSRQAGISMPRCTANPQLLNQFSKWMDREVQSPIEGVANRLHSKEGSRLRVSVLGTWTNEFAGSIAKSVDLDNNWMYRYLGIRVAESPIT